MMQVMSAEEIATRNAELKLELRVGTIFISQYLFPERKYCRMITQVQNISGTYSIVELSTENIGQYLQYGTATFEGLGCITIISQPEKAND